MNQIIYISILVGSCIIRPDNHDIFSADTSKCDTFYKCYYYNDLYTQPNTIKLNEAVHTVLLIPEVAKYADEVKDSMTLCVTNIEIDTNYLCKIIIGEEHSTQFSTRFRLYIARNNYQIFILDLVRDSIVSLDEWRINMGNEY
jgi:hypothetical protein